MVKQSGIQWRRMTSSDERMKANGLLLRGVVVTTYVIDDDHYPQVTVTDVPNSTSVLCDVLCYTNLPGTHWIVLRKVMVLQDKGGVHNGRIWKPKATTMDLSGVDLNIDGIGNPADFDGDHVLIGFIDGNNNQPIILGGVPHPSQDINNLDKDKGHRIQLKTVDGDPDFFKHHGSFYGIDDNGDYVVDTTYANDGKLTEKGVEADPPTDGKGSQKFLLPENATFNISILGETLKVEKTGANAKLTLGDGSKHVAIVEALQLYLDTVVKTWIIGHTHPTGVGPSGTPAESGVYPPWDTTINSTKVSIPNI